MHRKAKERALNQLFKKLSKKNIEPKNKNDAAILRRHFVDVRPVSARLRG
jgi:hypothetical protein